MHASSGIGSALFMIDPSVQLRMFFGHQSVGADLVQGLHEIADEPVPQITEEFRGEPAADWLLAHRRVGRNEAPKTKLAEFESLLASGALRHFDTVMLKFCYVDVRTEEQANDLFQAYDEFVERARHNHPSVRIAHCTIPLRRLPSGPYAFLRRMLGHRHPEIDANRAREQFNHRMRAQYRNEPIFDLARLEATQPHLSGTPVRQSQVPSLLAQYTDDGGHLNARGRSVMGKAFLQFMRMLGGR